MFARRLLAVAIVSLTVGPYRLAAAASGSTPQYDRLGRYRAQGENPYYHVNRYGYGNYVQGPNGSYGGYPAGSAGARELENEHDLKCRVYPESC